ncbi:hypothetical protein ACLBXX_02895 [Microbacterium sp. C23T]
MDETTVEHDVTLWMVDDIPVRMFYAGLRWRVSDTPTRLRESVWSAPLQDGRSLYGWRFQATDEDGASFEFDVFRTEDNWHVHRAYT